VKSPAKIFGKSREVRIFFYILSKQVENVFFFHFNTPGETFIGKGERERKIFGGDWHWKLRCCVQIWQKEPPTAST